MALCKSIDLSDLPAERVWGEIEKLLMQSELPSVGLTWLRDLGVIEKSFPEISCLISVPQDPVWHPEGDVFVHTQLVIDQAHELITDLEYPQQVTVMLAALAHDFGKPSTTEYLEGHWRSRGHEEAGVAPTTSFLDRLNVHSIDGYDVRGRVIALVREHLKPGEFYRSGMKLAKERFDVWHAGASLICYRVAKADSLGRNAPWVPRDQWYDADAQEWFIHRARELDVAQAPPNPISC